MSKATEKNKLKVKINRISWEFNFSWRFMCRDKNNDKNKRNPLLSSAPATAF